MDGMLSSKIIAVDSASFLNIPLVTAIVNNDTLCNGHGNIHLTATGGIAPLTFHWSNGATTADLLNIYAGNYFVTVTGGNFEKVVEFTVNSDSIISTLTVTNITSCRTRLKWTAIAQAAYYKVRYKAIATSTWSNEINVGTNLSYNFTNLVANTNYNFQVAAFCSSNANLGWKTKQALTKSCSTPTGIAYSVINSNSAIINWTAVCTPVSYKIIYRKLGSTAWTTITTLNTTITLTNLTAGNSYQYRVAAFCGNGIYSAYSLTGLFSLPVAIRPEKYFSIQNNWSIYPNPTNGSFKITRATNSQTGIVHVALINLVGQVVFENTFNSMNATINVAAEIKSGYYTILIDDGKNCIRKKLIVSEGQ